jgi:hypothetical protein
VTTVMMKETHRARAMNAVMMKETHRARVMNAVMMKETHRARVMNTVMKKETHRAQAMNAVMMKETHRARAVNTVMRKGTHHARAVNTVMMKETHRAQAMNAVMMKEKHRARAVNTVMMKGTFPVFDVTWSKVATRAGMKPAPYRMGVPTKDSVVSLEQNVGEGFVPARAVNRQCIDVFNAALIIWVIHGGMKPVPIYPKRYWSRMAEVVPSMRICLMWRSSSGINFANGEVLRIMV